MTKQITQKTVSPETAQILLELCEETSRLLREGALRFDFASASSISKSIIFANRVEETLYNAHREMNQP